MRLLAVVFASGLVGVMPACAQMGVATCPAVRRTVVTDLNGKVTSPGLVAYSLVRVRTTVQTLGNGTQITSRIETREWQDAQGRRRVESWIEHNGEMEFQNGSIFDPTLRESINLYPTAKVAQVTRFSLGVPVQQRPVDEEFNKAMQAEYQARNSLHSNIELRSENLDARVMFGECVQGNRTTQTIPAGEIGNDAEIQTASENWWAPRLGISIRSTMDDPRMGHVVDEVTELHVEAPDPSVFQPPPDYKVFDLTRDPAQP